MRGPVDNIGISAQITPNASFTWLETGGLDVSFTYTGTGTVQFFWDFDSDGNVDNTNAGSANYTYPDTGIYTATLVVSNTCGVDTTSVQINLIGLNNTLAEKLIYRLFPNPATYNLIIQSGVQFDKFLIMDLSGRVIQETNNAAETTIINVEDLSKGVYILQGIKGTQYFPAQRFVKN
ncbi:MAG: PKD domain-containing protein [Bacteroidia bacterium]